MKSLTKNMGVSIIARIVTLVTGLVVQHEILLTYGSVFNGLTSSISQIMSYLVLLEAGLGTASIQALYMPLAQGDWKKVSGILTATDKEYQKISASFFGLLLLISGIFPFVVKDQVDYWVSSLLMLIIGGSYVISYILGGKYKALLSADRKVYVINELDMVTIILSCVLRIIALRLGYGIVFVQVINLACVCIKNLGFYLYVHAKYKTVDYSETPDKSAVSKRWNVLVHNIAGIVVNHTDIVILTMFSSLKVVSVYSVYNLVFSQLSGLLQSTFLTAPQANFGRIYNADKKLFSKLYEIYETAFEAILHIIVAIAVIMILPFVRIYTHGVNDIDYTSIVLPILFALILLMNQMRVPMVMVVNIVGDFKETQKGAIIEACINLSVSLLLYFLTPLGLYGLLIGTVCSFLYRTCDLVIYTYTHIIRDGIVRLLKTMINNMATLILLYYIFCLKWPVRCETIGEWIVKATFVSIIVSVTYILTNYIFNRAIIHEMKNMLLDKIRR